MERLFYGTVFLFFMMSMIAKKDTGIFIPVSFRGAFAI